MNKILGSVLTCLILFGAALPSAASQISGQSLPIEAKLKTTNGIVELEVARTEEQQEIGLMYRRTLAPERGMLFVFEQPRYLKFWMKNTLIPLDMIFLRAGQIQAIIANVPPCYKDPCPSYGPYKMVDQVIELKAGEATKLGLKLNSSVDITFSKQK